MLLKLLTLLNKIFRELISDRAVIFSREFLMPFMGAIMYASSGIKATISGRKSDHTTISMCPVIKFVREESKAARRAGLPRRRP